MHRLTEKVDRLERAIMELVYIQHKTEMEIQSLKKEMKEFKDEMKEFKKEMKEFKDEMREFKDRMEKEVRRMNKQWGELANKMGTIVEDIVFPAARPVIRKYFKCDPLDLMMNVERKRGKKREEFDVIAICEDKVFLIEVKSTLRQEHVGYIKEKAERFRELFPEYRNKDIILILASLSIKKEVLNKLTKEGIYGMAYREWEYMDILNFEEVER
ncbi:hypothetical protein GFV12_06715 [Desulfurobacterium thermolithotrophum]|uniref:hypothetical protein n=1 Tax=Desulfurobacterium thermolithotrophum TaxID=64160 RepID=UPI003984CC2C